MRGSCWGSKELRYEQVRATSGPTETVGYSKYFASCIYDTFSTGPGGRQIGFVAFSLGFI